MLHCLPYPGGYLDQPAAIERMFGRWLPYVRDLYLLRQSLAMAGKLDPVPDPRGDDAPETASSVPGIAAKTIQTLTAAARHAGSVFQRMNQRR